MQKRDSAIVASTAIYFDFRVIEFEPIRFDFYLNLNWTWIIAKELA